MNISGLIRSFIGDMQAAEPKKLELKTGEVVKGVVQQLLPNDEAMLNIGGVQVRAKLETPLKQGEVTLLQVQPETSGGQVVLKPLNASGVQIADSSLSDLLKNVGLPDTTANRQLVQALHQAGIPLAKETVQAFVQLQSQMPASMKQEDWLPSAIIAFQKGVPLTPDSVTSVKQAMTGPAFHDTLQQLDGMVQNLLTGTERLLSPSSQKALVAFQQVLTSMKEASGQVMQPQDKANTSAAPSDEAEAASGRTLAVEASKGQAEPPVGSSNRVQGSLINSGTFPTGTEGSGGQLESTDIEKQGGLFGASRSNAGSTAAVIGNDGTEGLPEQQDQAFEVTKGMSKGGLTGFPPSDYSQAKSAEAPASMAYEPDSPVVAMPLESAMRSSIGGKGLTKPPALGQGAASGLSVSQGGTVLQQVSSDNGSLLTGDGAGTASTTTSAAKPAVDAAVASALNSERGRAETERTIASTSSAPVNGQPSHQPQAAAADNEHWISRLVKALGVEHENQLFKLPEPGATNGQSMDRNGEVRLVQQQASGTPQEQKMADTLKSALLQLVQADDIPTSLKDTAQQAVQHITGQQLMLHSDKTSMFSHITLFVPLLNANGEQTAAIHIQSRKGKRGEIDAQNCRLVFDLRMKTLGDTMVDVQVVDRIVSLQVHNDQPYIHRLLEEHRDDIAASLSGIGYQFISLKCSPYPEKGQDSSSASAADRTDFTVPMTVQSAYGTKPYRGMDVRV